jgi:uncharacterized protein
MMKKLILLFSLSLLAFALVSIMAQQTPTPKKRLLAVGMSTGWHHESVSDALGTLYELGQESGLWETFIHTDVGPITKKKLPGNAKNLDYFDAIFFMTTGELPMDDQQKADFLSFVRDDGKGFLGAHNATDTFYKWQEYGEMIGGYFDGHPWMQFNATVKVEDPDFPAMKPFPPTFQIVDEIYQTKEFSRAKVRVLMSLDTSKVDLNKQGVHTSDIPVAWARNYGKGRVFYSGLGHRPEIWQRKDVRQMWTEAVKWSMGLTEGDATPRP